jgi:hypothetical protein
MKPQRQQRRNADLHAKPTLPIEAVLHDGSFVFVGDGKPCIKPATALAVPTLCWR